MGGIDKRAMLWKESAGFTDLNPSGWSWSRATAINNSGVVVGYGKNADGQTRSFRLFVNQSWRFAVVVCVAGIVVIELKNPNY